MEREELLDYKLKASNVVNNEKINLPAALANQRILDLLIYIDELREQLHLPTTKPPKE